MKLMRVALSELMPPEHPVRAAWDENKLMELSAHIKAHGVLVPLVVEKRENGYEVVYGHRRLVAAQRANITTVPVLVRDSKDAEAEILKVGENFGREELSPAEEAAYYAEVFERVGQDVDKVAAAVGMRREYVESRLNLLRGAPEVLNALVGREISLGVAQQLNKMKREEDRRYCLEFARRDGCTVATAAAWVQTYNNRPEGVVPPSALPDATPAPAAPLANPMKCWICESSEEPWELRLVYEHTSCRRMLDRQAAAATMAAAKNQ